MVDRKRHSGPSIPSEDIAPRRADHLDELPDNVRSKFSGREGDGHFVDLIDPQASLNERGRAIVSFFADEDLPLVDYTTAQEIAFVLFEDDKLEGAKGGLDEATRVRLEELHNFYISSGGTPIEVDAFGDDDVTGGVSGKVDGVLRN